MEKKEELNAITPIKNLNPFQSKWKIIVRVFNKNNIHLWKNENSTGKLFKFGAIDKSGCIQITTFNDNVDKFFDKIENNKVYTITKATIKETNPKYTTNNNNFEIILNNDSEIELSEGNNDDIPQKEYKFSKIPKLQQLHNNDLLNTIGICFEIKSLEEFVAKTNNTPLKKETL